jgi:enoyl-[acyl-carrier protein] reductase I
MKTFFNNVKAQWDSIDFLVHSVAFANKDDLTGRFLDTSRENYHLAIDISSYSLLALAREAVPLMTNGGNIVAMTYYGAEKVIPNYNIMGVVKATLEATVKYLASDLGSDNIRVNCVSASPVRTLSSAAISGFKKMLNTTADNAPLRRNITQAEVAKSTLYLLSDMASGVTGEVHHVDSGYNILGMFTADES